MNNVVNETTPKKSRSTLNNERITAYLVTISILAMTSATLVFSAYFVRFAPNSGFSTINSDWGTFGDFIGGTLNPILSFLALIALLFTIAIQTKGLDLSRRELELTRLELEATRTELKRSATAQEETKKIMTEQYKTQIKQQFDSSFFALLNHHNEIMRLITKNTLTKSLSNICTKLVSSNSELNKIDRSDFEPCLDYLRMLNELLELTATKSKTKSPFALLEASIFKTSHKRTDDEFYVGIIKAHLSSHLLCLIGFYSTFIEKKYPSNTLPKLIAKYQIFENLPTSMPFYGVDIVDILNKHRSSS